MLIIVLSRLKAKLNSSFLNIKPDLEATEAPMMVLFTVQILIEKVKEVSQEAFITFIDYSKAFDNVRHEHLFNTMEQMGFPKHLVVLLQRLYTDQLATIRWNNQHCDLFPIKNEYVRDAFFRLICLAFIQSR